MPGHNVWLYKYAKLIMGCVCNMNKQGVLGELCQATKCEFRIWPDDMYHDTVVTIYYMVTHCNIVSQAICCAKGLCSMCLWQLTPCLGQCCYVCM